MGVSSSAPKARTKKQSAPPLATKTVASTTPTSTTTTTTTATTATTMTVCENASAPPSPVVSSAATKVIRKVQQFTGTATAPAAGGTASSDVDKPWLPHEANAAKALILFGHLREPDCPFSKLPPELVVAVLSYVTPQLRWQWDSSQNIIVSNHNLSARRGPVSSASQWVNSTATIPLRRNCKQYFELLFEKFGGSSIFVGIAPQRITTLQSPIGNKTIPQMPCWGLHCHGTLYLNNETGKHLNDIRFGLKDRVGVYVDLREGAIAWFKNGKQITDLYCDDRLVRKNVLEEGQEDLYPTLCWGGDSYCITWVSVSELPTPVHKLSE